jgi:hypothetical protein
MYQPITHDLGSITALESRIRISTDTKGNGNGRQDIRDNNNAGTARFTGCRPDTVNSGSRSGYQGCAREGTCARAHREGFSSNVTGASKGRRGEYEQLDHEIGGSGKTGEEAVDNGDRSGMFALSSPPVSISNETRVSQLFVSSGVSMLVPLTIGKLIDFFASPTHETFFGLSFPVAAAVLALTFCVGAAANAGRAILMRLSGQRIIARVR